MKTMRKIVVIAGLSVAILTACQSTPNPYPNGPGFYETQIERTRQAITYVIPNGMPRPRAEDFLLLRAADNTLAQGFDWFRVIDRSSDVDQRSGGPTISLGTGTTSFGGNTAVGLGLGTSFNLGGGPRAVLKMEIQMGDGAPPIDDARAYDASDVAQTIRARL